MKVILASGSPRRKELLEMMGIKFEIKTSDVGNGEAAADNGFANFADSDGIRKWTAEPVISRKNTKRIG